MECLVTEHLVRIWVDVGGIVGDNGSIFVVYKPEYSGEVIGVYGVIVLFVTSSIGIFSRKNFYPRKLMYFGVKILKVK